MMRAFVGSVGLVLCRGTLRLELKVGRSLIKAAMRRFQSEAAHLKPSVFGEYNGSLAHQLYCRRV